MGAGPPTSPTLLGRLRQVPPDQEAWDEFVRRYGGKVFQWCRHFGLAEADADDVTQDVFTRLVKSMGAFSYDPGKSFRCWLKTVTHHAWHDFCLARRRALPGGPGDGAADPLLTVAAREDLENRLRDEFDYELLQEALTRVRLRVEPANYDAFRLTALEGLDAAEAARRLGRTVAQVYTARCRVQDKLRREIERLEHGHAEDNP